MIMTFSLFPKILALEIPPGVPPLNPEYRGQYSKSSRDVNDDVIEA